MTTNKSVGNINLLPDFRVSNATIDNLTATNFIAPIQPTAIYSTSTINNNAIVVGDLGSRNVKQTGILVDVSNNITGVSSIVSGSGSFNNCTSGGVPFISPNSVGLIGFPRVTILLHLIKQSSLVLSMIP